MFSVKKSICCVVAILFGSLCNPIVLAQASLKPDSSPQQTDKQLKPIVPTIITTNPAIPADDKSKFSKLYELSDTFLTSYNEAKNSNSEDRIIREQLVVQNLKLRDEIDNLMSSDLSIQEKVVLLKFIRQQKTYADEAYDFFYAQVKTLEKSLDNPATDKNSALSNIGSLRLFIVDIIVEQWANFQWMRQLGVPNPAEEDKLKDQIKRMLDLASTETTYLQKEIDSLSDQIKQYGAGGEKTKLEDNKNNNQRQLDSSLERLNKLIKLGDKMGLDTAVYKMQRFESTGKISDDLLNKGVGVYFIKKWTLRSKIWITRTAPNFLFQVIICFAIVYIGRKLGKFARKIIARIVASDKFDMSKLMQEFVSSMSGKLVFIISILIALSQFGINLAPVLAGFGVAGIIIGFALQDTLSNFASGMMLLIYRPFDVSDYVEAGGVSGKVSHMSLVNTTIKTFDNQIIIIPNKKIWGDIIKNITHERVRRVDMTFNIGYSDSIELAEKILADITLNHEKVLSLPECTIKLNKLGESSLDFIVRPWVRTDDYWDVYWDITRAVKLRFDEAGLSIPFVQRDVHLHLSADRESDKNKLSRQLKMLNNKADKPEKDLFD